MTDDQTAGDGRIVYEPAVVRGHGCRPPRNPSRATPLIERYSGHPDGTIWECICGKTWVTHDLRWYPERWFARWLRKRRDRKNERRLISEYRDAAVAGSYIVLHDIEAPPEDLPPTAAILPFGIKRPRSAGEP